MSPFVNTSESVSSPSDVQAPLQPAVTGSDLRHGRLHNAEVLGLVVRQLVHRREGNVEPRPRVVDSEDVDRVVLVLQLPACAAVGRVPACQ